MLTWASADLTALIVAALEVPTWVKIQRLFFIPYKCLNFSTQEDSLYKVDVQVFNFEDALPRCHVTVLYTPIHVVDVCEDSQLWM